MRLECSLKRLFTGLLCGILVLCSTGCHKEPVQQSISLGEWIHELVMKAGIEELNETSPYYFNINASSPYFEDIQKAVEWGILEADTSFEPSETLSREWCAYTLINLSGIPLNQADSMIKDSGKSRFPKHIATAYAKGLMNIDKKQRFYPDDPMEENIALSLADQVIDWMDHKELDVEEAIIEWDDATTLDEPLEFNEDQQVATYDSKPSVKKDDVVIIPYKQEKQVYRVKEVHKTYDTNNENNNHTTKEPNLKKEDSTIELPSSDDIPSLDGNTPLHYEEVDSYYDVELKPVEIEEDLKNFEAKGSYDLNLDEATIIDDTDGFVVQQGMVLDGVETRQLVSTSSDKSRSKTIHGYTITYWVNRNRIRAEVKKETPHGWKMFANCKLYDIRPTYDWKMKKGKIDHAYFRIDYKTNEAMGIRNGMYDSYYADFRDLDPSSFVSLMDSMFVKKQDMECVTIPIATIKTPLPKAPMLKLLMQLQVKIYANGKVEISLNQNHVCGFEYRNKTMRSIVDHSHNANALIRGDASALTCLSAGLDLGSAHLCNASIEAGSKALVQNTLHLYDKEGNHYVKKDIDVPSDVLENAAKDNKDVLVCGDMDAYLVLDVDLNSSDTMLGRIGLHKHIPLLNKKNNSLLPHGNRHVENWQFVDHCTRGDKKKETIEQDPTKQRITIKDYSIHLDIGDCKQLVITSLPDSYSQSDLNFVVRKPNIASVSNQGLVTGINEGDTMVRIVTSDNKYEIYCNVHVRKKGDAC